MHFSILLLATVTAVLAVPQPQGQWEEFKLAHNKVYDGEEEAYRFKVFSENLKKINEHNDKHAAGLKTYRLGVNQFADMTAEEFKNYLTMSGPNPNLKSQATEIFTAPEGVEIPDSIDYRKKNAVNAVKNQGSCGSCWAFSTVGSLESINYLKTGKLLSLSEQNLVDCSSSYGNQGCNGGLMEDGYNYIKDNGIESESAYPYKAYDSSCKFSKTKSVLRISGHKNVAAGDEDDLKAAVGTVGPVAVAVDATEWQFYEGGVFTAEDDDYSLNHGVVSVGYGSENGQDYWIVRNSWGASWGESGYIRVARGSNQVGISDMACFPTL